MLVLAITLMKKCNKSLILENFYRTNLPSDSDGKVCELDYPTHPFIYFIDPNDVSKVVCV